MSEKNGKASGVVAAGHTQNKALVLTPRERNSVAKKLVDLYVHRSRANAISAAGQPAAS